MILSKPFFKAGRGSGNEDLEITGSEYFYAMANVDGVNPLGAVARSLDTLRGRGVTKCAMADSEISISENGDVFPCQMLTDEEFCGGSIKTQSIKEILNSEVFKNVSSFSSTTNKGCKACPIKLLCGGACRARSYFETGSLFINSDFCEYEKLAYINAILEYTELEEI
jgi:radical SAM protein with 4Fe4S-binding SPASM domain